MSEMQRGPLFFQELAHVQGDLETCRQLVLSWYESGLLEQLFPGFGKLKGCTQHPKQHAEGDALEHTAWVFAHAAQDTSVTGVQRALLLAAALLHDIEKPQTRMLEKDGRITFLRHADLAADRCPEFAKTLGLDNEMAEALQWVILHHMDAHVLLQMRASGREEFYSNPFFYVLAALQGADALASWHSPDGTEHAPDLRQAFMEDALSMRKKKDAQAARGAFNKRVVSALRGLGRAPGPMFSQATQAAWESSQASVSDVELTAWLKSWLSARPKEEAPAPSS
jgi:putative nucleotidyltransferase with HDIG domain